MNLLENLESRSCGFNRNAITSVVPYETLSQNSCYATDYEEIKRRGGKITIGLDFAQPVFMHAILHAQDLSVMNNKWEQKSSNTDVKNYFQTYEIYIGDNPDYN